LPKKLVKLLLLGVLKLDHTCQPSASIPIFWCALLGTCFLGIDGFLQSGIT